MNTATDKMWNLTADQWSSVLDSRADPADVAPRLTTTGLFVPWSQVLVDETADCVSAVDLGCGRGEHSAVLARAGRQTRHPRPSRFRQGYLLVTIGEKPA